MIRRLALGIVTLAATVVLTGCNTHNETTPWYGDNTSTCDYEIGEDGTLRC